MCYLHIKKFQFYLHNLICQYILSFHKFKCGRILRLVRFIMSTQYGDKDQYLYHDIYSVAIEWYLTKANIFKWSELIFLFYYGIISLQRPFNNCYSKQSCLTALPKILFIFFDSLPNQCNCCHYQQRSVHKTQKLCVKVRWTKSALTLHKKWSFLLNSGFGHIYRRNP